MYTRFVVLLKNDNFRRRLWRYHSLKQNKITTNEFNGRRIPKFFGLAVYTISDLEKLTGIKAHTLRMWEKRYALVEPKRTKTNIRYYLDEDLQILLNASLLSKSGYRISKIAEMSKAEMTQLAMQLHCQSDEMTETLYSDALTISLVEMDAEKFHTVIDRNIQELGYKRTITEVIMPFLERLNLLWMTGAVTPVQENYFAGLIKRKLFVYIDENRRKKKKSGSKRIILYLPEDEKQELSLYFLHFMLLEEDFEVMNLGMNISLLDLKKATSIRPPDAILTLINDGFRQGSVRQYIDNLCLHFRSFPVIVSGAQIIQQGIKSTENIQVASDLNQINELLRMTTVDASRH